MSDTGKTILWIVVAIVVIAVIIWLFVSAGRRREVEARRFEAGELRAKVDERLPEVQDTEDRASVTAAMAADARAEAERKAAEAERVAAEARRLEEQAEAHRASAESARIEHAGLEREADRVDPDVATDDEGYRVDDAGNRLPGQEPPRGTGAAGAAGAGAAGAAAVGAAAFAHDDDEDDLADAENPFAPSDAAATDEQDGTSVASEPIESAAVAPVDDETAHTRDADEPAWTPSEDVSSGESPDLASDVDLADERMGDESSYASDEPEVTGRADDGDETDDTAPASTSWAPTETDAADTGAETGAERGADEDATDGTTDDPGTSALGGAAMGAAAVGAAAASHDDRDGYRDGNRDDDVDNSGAVTEVATSDAAVAGTAAVAHDDVADASTEDSAGTGTATEQPSDERSTTVSDTQSDATGPTDTTDATDEDYTPPVADAEEPREVSVPALDERDDVVTDGGIPTDDPGDHRGQPWATTPGERGLEEGADVDGDAADAGLDVDMAPHSHESDEDDELAEPADAGTPSDSTEDSAPGRRVSGFDEVVDGGFGLGSAAPLADGAQPLGHAVKGTREGTTFVGPDDAGYDDVEPDVWFYSEDAARRAGFRRQGE